MGTWNVVEADDYHLTARYTESNGELAYQVNADAQGCVHLWRFMNGADDIKDHRNVDYVHICDLPSLIAGLTELQNMAKKQFGEEW